MSAGLLTVQAMRVLHTSDWHIGRTFHTHSTLEHVREVLAAVAVEVRERAIDVVLVAGDVFDSGVPSADALEVLTDAFRAIRQAGAVLVVTSGNHDSIVRLGYGAEWLADAGIHVLTRHTALDRPVTIDGADGPVHVYGIPYLEPALLRHAHPDETLRTHADVLGWAMDRIRADHATRGGRYVVMSHCFASGVAAAGPERDITSGGLDLVPASVFDGPDYVALGHIHGRNRISERVRYSGAPLHYSFSELDSPRGGWLLELDADGLGPIEWVDLPVPRDLVQLTGTLASLLADPAHQVHAGSWVRAVLTDDVRPVDAMRRLQARFPHCVDLSWAPENVAAADGLSYAERVGGRTDAQIIAGFLEHVRNGHGPDAGERDLIDELLTAQRIEELTA